MISDYSICLKLYDQPSRQDIKRDNSLWIFLIRRQAFGKEVYNRKPLCAKLQLMPLIWSGKNGVPVTVEVLVTIVK